MKLTKFPVTQDTSNRLRVLAGRTGLTPNLICRLGFYLSLKEPSIPNPDDYPEEELEFNRQTRLGEYDDFFVGPSNQRRHDGLDSSRMANYFRAHINRGVALLQVRLKGIGDLAELVTST